VDFFGFCDPGWRSVNRMPWAITFRPAGALGRDGGLASLAGCGGFFRGNPEVFEDFDLRLLSVNPSD
jgi:hypothetical protein